MSRATIPLAVAVLAVAIGAAVAQERIEPLPGAQKQQEIEILTPSHQQTLESVEPGAEQEVRENHIPSPAQRTISTAGKVLVGILATGVALGTAVASLLLL